MEAARRIFEPLDEVTHETQRSRTVQRWQDGVVLQAIDQVAEEVPVAMVYNGISHAVMLATPSGLRQFGLGFSLSEGILHDRSELYDLEIVSRTDGIELQMTIAAERFAALKERRRNLTGRTGCGLCGTESLAQVARHPKRVQTNLRISSEVLHSAFDRMTGSQALQTVTGATHAAAWVLADGSIAHIEEDIGRHNALDKLIGALALNSTLTEQGFAIVTSRASYEMVQKAATAGIGLLAAVSAPTGLAVDMAEESGVTLVGFARKQSHVVYAHPQRIE